MSRASQQAAYASSQQQQQKYHKGGVAPTNTVAPVISGTATTGSTLTSTSGAWTGDPTITYGYQWQRAGSNISAATASTYVLVTADEALAITCVVTGTNAKGSSTGTSNTITPAVTAPTNTVAPVISGTATTGSTLTSTTGTWTGSPTYTYQWQRAGSNIGSATASTYVLVTADEAQAITCVVTGTNAGGSATGTSNTITPLTAYAVAVAADSPVAWWHLGDAGATAVESIAAINGAYQGSPSASGTLVARGDGCHDFNGGQYVSVAGTAALKVVSGTLEAWVNMDTFASSTRPICLCANRFMIEIDAAGHVTTTFYNGSANRSATSTAVLTPGVTYHLVGRWNNATKVESTFINGVLDGTATWTSQVISYAAGTNSAIGSESGGSAANDVDGRIDEVAVYNTALSDARILAHYTAGTT